LLSQCSHGPSEWRKSAFSVNFRLDPLGHKRLLVRSLFEGRRSGVALQNPSSGRTSTLFPAVPPPLSAIAMSPALLSPSRLLLNTEHIFHGRAFLPAPFPVRFSSSAEFLPSFIAFSLSGGEFILDSWNLRRPVMYPLKARC